MFHFPSLLSFIFYLLSHILLFLVRSSFPASPAGMDLMHQAKLHIEEAVQELELKVNGQFDLTNEEQIALREDIKTTIEASPIGLLPLKTIMKI